MLMTTPDIDILKKEMKARGLAEKTVDAYAFQLKRLFDFYPSVPPKDITREQVERFTKSLVQQKYSTATIKLLYNACSFFFDVINQKPHAVYRVRLPEAKPSKKQFLNQEDTFTLIDSYENIKHRCMISLIYSCALDVNELLAIELNHIRTKEKHPRLLVYNSRGEVARSLPLSARLIFDLSAYYKEYKPTKWFFYSQNGKDKPYTANSLRKVLEAGISHCNLNPEIKPRELKTSYIAHMVALGVPLIQVLNHLDINSFEAHLQYSKAIFGEYAIDFSPLDRLVAPSASEESFDDLEALVFEIKNKEEMKYMLEALTCFRSGALRAGVIFVWTAAILNIQHKILEIASLSEINAELKNLDNSAKPIKNIDGFTYLKDATTLVLSQKVGLFDKFERLELVNNCLGLRNKCGHPSDYWPESQKVKAYLEDVINIVYKKTTTSSKS